MRNKHLLEERAAYIQKTKSLLIMEMPVEDKPRKGGGGRVS